MISPQHFQTLVALYFYSQASERTDAFTRDNNYSSERTVCAVNFASKPVILFKENKKGTIGKEIFSRISKKKKNEITLLVVNNNRTLEGFSKKKKLGLNQVNLNQGNIIDQYD